MEARKQTESTHGKTDDDIYIEEFGKSFFGTNQTDNDSLQAEKPETTLTESNKERRKDDETHNQTIYNTESEQSKNKTKVEKRRVWLQEHQKTTSKHKGPQSSHSLHPRDSRQSIVERFLVLRNEFLYLSERLHDLSMPKISKKLTKVLRERQKLMKLLLDMDVHSSPDVSIGREEKWFEDDTRSEREVPKQGFRMPKKTKSVHWSDEHLGGSIIKDPILYPRQSSYPGSKQIQTPYLKRYDENRTKPPPRYKMVNRQTQTESSRPLDLGYCNSGVNHEIEYIKEILDKAAELRREACCMIWRAHYLEQFCDADGLVKHIFHSTSNVPTLPSYSHLYR